jgi:hypothetical protein
MQRHGEGRYRRKKSWAIELGGGGLRRRYHGNKEIDYENGTWVQQTYDCVQLLT